MLNDASKPEGVWDRTKRFMSNVYARTVTSSKNTQEAVKIQQQVKREIANRKKSFGIEYVNLVMEKNATHKELEACAGRAVQDVADLQDKMKKCQEALTQNKQELHQKLSSSRRVVKNATSNQSITNTTAIVPRNPSPSAPYDTNVY